ncbi:MAG TPA: hypothetical protein VGR08_13780 [Thermomicrobiales bacterium]|nr:hypothetical protein [Thermomicrobiales bacterium]
MNPHRFDALTTTLGVRLSRRRSFQSTILGLAAGLTGSAALRASDQEASPSATLDSPAHPVFLFVQTSTSGSFTANPAAGTPAIDGTPSPGGGAEYLLTLQGHGGGTVYFSDRPERIFSEASTQAFLDGLGFSPANPPNAALVTQTEAGTDAVEVVELLNPTYDESTGMLTYGARILSEYEGEGLAHVAANRQDAELPKTFGRSSLFIDDCPGETISCNTYDGTCQGDIGVGGCWNYRRVQCEICPRDPGFYDELCNDTFPDQCKGECLAENFIC